MTFHGFFQIDDVFYEASPGRKNENDKKTEVREKRKYRPDMASFDPHRVHEPVFHRQVYRSIFGQGDKRKLNTMNKIAGKIGHWRGRLKK